MPTMVHRVASCTACEVSANPADISDHVEPVKNIFGVRHTCDFVHDVRHSGASVVLLARAEHGMSVVLFRLLL